jgi:hypothetical protein
VKDHLAHLAAWNLSLVALLEGRDREAALGVGGVSSETAANEVRPDGAQPVLGWINGNTDQHADEHSGYIRELSLQVPSP